MYCVAFHKYFLFPNVNPCKLIAKFAGKIVLINNPVQRDIDPIITHITFS